jgi:hypothetical protein
MSKTRSFHARVSIIYALLVIISGINNYFLIVDAIRCAKTTASTSQGEHALFGYTQMEKLVNRKEIIAVLVNSIENSTLQSLNTADERVHYVSRPSIEKEFQKGIQGAVNTMFTVVYGPTGFGKSTVINHVIQNQKGVMKIPILAAKNMDDIFALISDEIAYENKSKVDGLALVTALKMSTVTPILVFDVKCEDRSIALRCIQSVRNVVKVLSMVSYCIVELPHPGDVLEFNRFSFRAQYVYVGEFKLPEARNFVQIHGLEVLSGVFIETTMSVSTAVGTDPRRLQDLLNLTQNPSHTDMPSYILHELQLARRELKQFRYQEILYVLASVMDCFNDVLAYINVDQFKIFDDSNRIHKVGYHDFPTVQEQEHAEEVKDIWNPQNILSTLRSTNVLLYRPEHGIYQIATRAHQTALRLYYEDFQDFDSSVSVSCPKRLHGGNFV